MSSCLRAKEALTHSRAVHLIPDLVWEWRPPCWSYLLRSNAVVRGKCCDGICTAEILFFAMFLVCCTESSLSKLRRWL